MQTREAETPVILPPQTAPPGPLVALPNGTHAPPAQLLERVVLHGDLSRLTAEERVRYYAQVCESLGLNPLTQPFAFIVLNGKLTLYARKDATEQLRRLHRVSVQIVGRELVEGVYVVTARATTADGRHDESIGAVPVAQSEKAESRANAIMKAETKAKRRVTLSLCGLGLLDETELATVPVDVPTYPPPGPPVAGPDWTPPATPPRQPPPDPGQPPAYPQAPPPPPGAPTPPPGPPPASAPEPRITEAQEQELVAEIQKRGLQPAVVSSALASVGVKGNVPSCPAGRYEDLRHALCGTERQTADQAVRVDELVGQLALSPESFLNGVEKNFRTRDPRTLTRKQTAELVKLLESLLAKRSAPPTAA